MWSPTSSRSGWMRVLLDVLGGVGGEPGRGVLLHVLWGSPGGRHWGPAFNHGYAGKSRHSFFLK